MSIRYEVHLLDGIIRETWSGEITIEQVRSHWGKLLQDDACLVIAKTLADLRLATLLFSDQDLLQAIQDIGRPQVGGHAWATALVVRRSSQLRMASRYQGLAIMSRRSAIFSQMEEAERWLLKQDIALQ